MTELTGYCLASLGHPVHGPFHDMEHGFPVRDDHLLFGRLLLEINQAGLSWLTILKKRDTLQAAYAGFNVDAVAAFGEEDVARLLDDPGVIRNRLKVAAAIHNARAIVKMREEHTSFAGWLDAHHPLAVVDWVQLFKKTFRFTGGDITHEFLMGAGYLPGAHDPRCPVSATIAALDPPWMRT